VDANPHHNCTSYRTSIQPDTVYVTVNCKIYSRCTWIDSKFNQLLLASKRTLPKFCDNPSKSSPTKGQKYTQNSDNYNNSLQICLLTDKRQCSDCKGQWQWLASSFPRFNMLHASHTPFFQKSVYCDEVLAWLLLICM